MRNTNLLPLSVLSEHLAKRGVGGNGCSGILADDNKKLNICGEQKKKKKAYPHIL